MSSYYDAPITDFLPHRPAGFARSPYAVEANPWSRRGEVEAALLFRGAIVSSYGFVETRLAELAIRASRLQCYASLSPTFPYTASSRIAFLRKAFAFGPLEPHQQVAETFFRRFEKSANLRHLIAHGRMQVSPDWGVVLEDFQPQKGGGIFQRRERFLLRDLEIIACRTTRFARLSQLLAGKLDEQQLLPPL